MKHYLSARLIFLGNDHMSQGSNSSALRHFNERVVISVLRKQGSASKPELARLVGLTLPTLARIIDDLEARELLQATGRTTQGVGKPSNIYQINPESLYSIGIHFDREIINFMLTNFSGKPLATFSAKYKNIDPATLVEIICKEAKALFAKLTPNQVKKFAGVGIAMPWFLGSWSEMAEDISKQWMDFDLAATLEKKLPYKFFYENNCTAAAAAELYFGDTNGANNLLYIYIGSFIGGGLILNGDLERGVFSNAACLATMPVPPSSLPNSTTQNFTTLVNRASINSLIEYLNFHKVEITHISHLADIIDSSRSLIHEWMLDCTESLIFAIHSSISLLDLEKVIIDSDLPSYLLTELINMVKRKLDKTKRVNLFIPEVQQGSLGTHAKILGGAILPLYAHFAPDKTVILKGGIPHRNKSVSD